jgi:hypothetical protein
MNRSDFFYCYSQRVSDFLKTQGVQFIHIAQEPKSKRLYSLYYIDSQLQAALDKYKQS